MTGKITVTNPNNNAYKKELALKNNALYFSCVTRINNILIDDAQNLDIVMPLCNLLYYSKNYQKTSGRIFAELLYEPNSGAENGFNYSIKDSKSFSYKTSLTGKLKGNNTQLQDIKFAVPLKYLANFLET